MIKDLEHYQEMYGDLEVSLYTDHGQTNSPADGLYVVYVDSDLRDDYVDPVDADDSVKETHTLTLEIYGE